MTRERTEVWNNLSMEWAAFLFVGVYDTVMVGEVVGVGTAGAKPNCSTLLGPLVSSE